MDFDKGGCKISSRPKKINPETQPGESFESIRGRLIADGVLTRRADYLTGQVTHTNPKKGFGFIRAGDQDYFLHTSRQKDPREKIKTGDMVTFRPVEHEGKHLAYSVRGVVHPQDLANI